VNLSFTYDNNEIEIAESFKYLGVSFSKTDLFTINTNQLYDKATKSMYGDLSKFRCIDCKFDIY